MTRITDDKLMEWYNHLQEFKKSNLSLSEYSRENKISKGQLYDYKIRIDGKWNKEETENLLSYKNEFEYSKLPTTKFCEQKNILCRDFKLFLMHLEYKEAIQRILKEKDNKMSFTQVIQPPKVIYQENTQNEEFIEKKNDIEITITKGVKVCIAPNIDSIKIIKIIELLKDL